MPNVTRLLPSYRGWRCWRFFSRIDEIGLNVHPVLLGSGVPAFLDAGSRTKLELTECRQLDGGCVLVTYAVKH